MCWGKGKRQTHYFKPFITCINISTEINKGWQACLEDSCSSLRLASLEQGLLGCHAYWPPVKPLHLFLIIHLEQGDWRSCQGELLPQYGMDILQCEIKSGGRSRFCLGDKTLSSFIQLCLLPQFVLQVHYGGVSCYSFYHSSLLCLCNSDEDILRSPESYWKCLVY